MSETEAPTAPEIVKNGENFWVKIVTQVGFPIAVAAYLLVRMEPRIEKLTEAISSLNTTVTVLSQRIK